MNSEKASAVTKKMTFSSNVLQAFFQDGYGNLFLFLFTFSLVNE